jgi:general secretion pathway protein M
VNAFYRLPRRDQLALLLGAVVLLLYALGRGVLLPLHDYGALQARRSEALLHSWQQVQALAGEIAALERSGGERRADRVDLPQLVDRSLRQHGLSMSGFQPGREGDVRLRLEGVDFQPLLHWLYQLETQHPVRVAELSVLPTRQPSRVSVQLRLLGVPR